LSNGLRVIYAPMPTSPTTHVRVIYHVGSRDERVDRQGFAHMFEHMMFRGSAHVKPQEHMKLIGLVGGYSNAFTSFDKTVYVNTLPAMYTPLALWLEADRMSSFKVSPKIFYTERQVVAEEWRMRSNQPYGTMYEDLLPAIYRQHPYRWTPIGKMEQLQEATAGELQEFFNRYYVPNNAILVVAGNIDVAKTKEQVHQLYGWIPGSEPVAGGAGTASWKPIPRDIPREPPQTEPRRVEVAMRVPLPRVLLAYRMPPNASDDLEALGLTLSILGDGQSSRINKALVTTDNPLCVAADAVAMDLEDGGPMGLSGIVLRGKDPAEVEKVLRQQVAALRDTPVPAEELEKVKQQARLGLARRFDTAEKVATELGDELLIRNRLDRVATARQRLEAVTPADIQRMARTYFGDDQATTMIVRPGVPATQPAFTPAPIPETADSEPAPATKPVTFPASYPATPPMSGNLPAATFEKGTETAVTLPGASAPVRVIVMEDHRTPTVSWWLVMRSGSHSEPAGKEGLGDLAAEMVRRGPRGQSFDAFNDALESRAISMDVADFGDNTQVRGSGLKEQFPFALNAAKQMLVSPAFDPAEFDRLKAQTVDSLRVTLTTPQQLAARELTHAIYGDSPLGRLQTIQTVEGVTLDDVKNYYRDQYHVDNAVFMIAGDITVAEGQRAAANFLAGLPTGPLPKVTYPAVTPAAGRRVLLVDLPSSKQSAIRLGVPAYSIASDEKFAGTLAGQMLSSGIDSRLGRYVRAEKGYVYGVTSYFQPNRQAGAFVGQTDTKFETTADTVKAMFKVFDDLKAQSPPATEMADAQFRVAGQLLMSMETINDQAQRRIDGILNNYPIDYYDKYAERVGKVTADEVRGVMAKYVDDGRMTVVVVAPAAAVRPQLEAGVGDVRVVLVSVGE
jgi:zinc protease